MAWGDPNVYYNPEKFGLTVVGDVEWAEPDYSYNTTVVWKNDEGYFMASDSGCSCPTPFEDYKTLEDLEGPMTKFEVAGKLMAQQESNWESNQDYSRGQVVSFIERLMN